MKRTSLRFGLATICLAGLTSISHAQSCGVESCDKGCASHACKKKCDDKGLLDLINAAASNFEAKLASLIPDSECECKTSACTCSKPLPGACSEEHYQAIEGVHSAPLPQVMSPIEMRNERPPLPQAVPSQAPRPLPVPPVMRPNVIAPETVPPPESQVDPFRDDTTSRLKPLPAVRASYLKPQRSVSADYDPQANRQSSAKWPSAQSSLSSGTTMPVLADTKSSRKSAKPGVSARSSSGAVVTASATVEAANPDYYHNGLRDK